MAAQSAAGQPDQARQTEKDAVEAVRAIDDPRDRSDFLVGLSGTRRREGLLAEALAAGRLIEPPAAKTSALGWVAVAQAEKGQIEEARATLNEAVAAAGMIEGGLDRAEVLSLLALAQAKAGMEDQAHRTFAEALAAAEKAEHPDDSSDCGAWAGVGEVAEVALDCGFLADALDFAHEVKYPRDRACLLCRIADAQIAAGLRDQARQTKASALAAAKSMEDGDLLLGNFADDQAKEGLYTEALTTARCIKGPAEKSATLCRIGAAQAEKGLLPEARQTWAEALAAARQIKVSTLKGRFFVPLAAAQREKKKALDEIADAQAKAGLAEESRKISAEAAAVVPQGENLNDDEKHAKSEKRKTLSELAVAQGDEGHFAEALATARQIKRTVNKVSALRHIADVQAKAGQTDGVRETLCEAFEVARQAQEMSSLADVADSQLEAGLSTAALTTAREMKEGELKAKTLAKVALSRFKEGQVEEARKILIDAFTDACGVAHREIHDKEAPIAEMMPHEKPALIEIADAQWEAGFLEDALITVRAQRKATDEKVWTLCAIGARRAEAGEKELARQTFSEALVTANRLEEPDTADEYRDMEGIQMGKAWAAHAVAIAQAKAGFLGDALATARGIQDPDVKVTSLYEIADTQPSAAGEK